MVGVNRGAILWRKPTTVEDLRQTEKGQGSSDVNLFFGGHGWYRMSIGDFITGEARAYDTGSQMLYKAHGDL